MPDFTFCGSEGMYPMLRDAYGVLLGTVKPGDAAEFSEAPDPDWQPYEGEPDPLPVPPAADTGQDSGSEDQPDSPGVQDDNEAGPSGSEED